MSLLKIPPSEKKSAVKTYKAELILLAVTFSWGLSFPLIKVSMQFVSPGLFVFIRFLVTLVIFIIVFRKKISLRKFGFWKYGLLLGVFLFSGFALQTLGLKFTSASKSAFITGTSLIMIPFVQYFVLKSKPKKENIAGAAIVMIGLYILSEAYFTELNTGDILTLLCALAFAIHIVLLDKFSGNVDFNYLVFGQFLAMAVLSLAYTVFIELFLLDELFIIAGSFLTLSLIYTSVVSTFLSIILMTKYQKETTPLRAGIIYDMESVFAVFFAFIIIGEVLNFNQIIGAVLMLTGLLISEFYSL